MNVEKKETQPTENQKTTNNAGNLYHFIVLQFFWGFFKKKT